MAPHHGVVLMSNATEPCLGCPDLFSTAVEAFDDPPPKRMDFCFFGHKSPEGRLSLYLFGGMQITAGTTNE